MTLLVMGVATFLIGLLPTYAAIGVAAPILLVVLRFVQRLGLGDDTKARAPILDVLKLYPRSVLTALGARLGVDIAFYTFALFILVYVAEQLDLPRSTALNAVLIASAFQLFLIPWFGHLSDVDRAHRGRGRRRAAVPRGHVRCDRPSATSGG